MKKREDKWGEEGGYEISLPCLDVLRIKREKREE